MTLAAGTGAAASVWEGASLPADARAEIHLTSTELPPFPAETSALVDPGTWARVLADSSSRCFLELMGWSRGQAIALRSVTDLKPDWALSARYLCMKRGWRTPRYAGPLYSWSRNRTLEERSYRNTDGTRFREDIYQYRPNGLVWAYRRRERREDLTGPWSTLDEYFDPSGALAGFKLMRVAAAGSDSTVAASDTLAVRWWRGAPVSEEVFQQKSGSFGKN